MTSSLTGKEQLAALFQETGLPPVVQDYFLVTCMAENLDDFLGTFTTDQYEAEVKTLIEARFSVKLDGPEDARISIELQRKFVARTRTAYAAAITLRSKVQSKDKEIADVEAPLGKEDMEQIDKSWKVLHTWRLIPSARACVQLLGRVFREFRTRKCVLHPVELAISMEVDKCVQESSLEPVGSQAAPGQPQLLVRQGARQSRRRVISTVLEYISALRVIFDCYAYVGSFTVEKTIQDRAGERVINVPFMPWQDALAYCDHCMSQAIVMGRRLRNEEALLSWLRRRDEMIRADTAHRINDLDNKLTAGEALTLAMSEHRHMWILQDGMSAEPLGSQPVNALTEQLEDPGGMDLSERQPRGQKRPRDDPPGHSRIADKSGWPRRHPDGRFICQFKSGNGRFTPICPDWNAGKCKKANCKKGRHVCAVVVGSQRPCQSSSHTALTHR